MKLLYVIAMILVAVAVFALSVPVLAACCLFDALVSYCKSLFTVASSASAAVAKVSRA